MPARVVNVRDYPMAGINAALPFIYVGRPNRAWQFAGHPLANPFKVSRSATDYAKRQVLARYEAWLDRVPALLQDLAKHVRRTGLPLACWCCTWDGESEPAPLCHAVILAKRIAPLLEEPTHAR